MNKRLLQLFTVLAFDSDTFNSIQVKYLTAGQRICINQERAHIMQRMVNDEPIIYAQSTIVEKVSAMIDQKLK